jgi:PleD family two-component response regulator
MRTLEESPKPISLIVLHLNMPFMDGFTVIRKIKESDVYIPIIVITGDKDSELEALTLVAVDFITKPFNLNEIIMARVNRSIELSEKRIIVRTAEKDELTDCYNKPVFMEYVERFDKYGNGEA